VSVGIVLLVVGGILIVVEITSLTFYLIAIALACFVAGSVSLQGASHATTVSVLGIATLLGLPLAHWIRLRLRNQEADRVSQDDTGRMVTVDRVGPDGLRVRYRGSIWSAHLSEGETSALQPGDRLRIERREANELILQPPAGGHPS
jgi:membrane protein implicated in regulation of membrane protease activity